MKLIVTGGRGFIGSHFIELAIANGDYIFDYDYMSYCSNYSLPFDNHENYKHIKEDICNITHLPTCDVLVNFAAETHVDNSIRDTNPFLKNNVVGVHNLLEIIRSKPKYERPLFVQISTDEVYGDRPNGEFQETDKLTPSNPYSASKAAQESIAFSYWRTYGIPLAITNTMNIIGETQDTEKFMPMVMYQHQ